MQPAEDLRRLVASAIHGRALGTDGQWATTFIFGRNQGGAHGASHSFLLETEAVLDRHNTILSRAEHVQKTGHDLQVPGVEDEQRFAITALSLGYIRELARGRGLTLGIGARASVNVLPRTLENAYGSRAPLGATGFLRLRPYHERAPGAMRMNPQPSGGHVHD